MCHFLPTLAVTIRRLHDHDKSGWWVVAPGGSLVLFVVIDIVVRPGGVIPIESGNTGFVLIECLLLIFCLVVAVVMMVWHCTLGTNGPNRFGPNPLQKSVVATMFRGWFKHSRSVTMFPAAVAVADTGATMALHWTPNDQTDTLSGSVTPEADASVNDGTGEAIRVIATCSSCSLRMGPDRCSISTRPTR